VPAPPVDEEAIAAAHEIRVNHATAMPNVSAKAASVAESLKIPKDVLAAPPSADAMPWLEEGDFASFVPPYFVPLSTVASRCNPPWSCEEALKQAQKSRFAECFHLGSENDPRLTLVRVNSTPSAHWMSAMRRDFNSCNDRSLLLAVMSLSCGQWDEVLNVEMQLHSLDSQQLFRSHNGLRSFMMCYPSLFVVGEQYCKRNSEPGMERNHPRAQQEPSIDMIEAFPIGGHVPCEDNPYLTGDALLQVLRRKTPQHEKGISINALLRGLSPAVKEALPENPVSLILKATHYFAMVDPSDATEEELEDGLRIARI
jgi:hypothetical protein